MIRAVYQYDGGGKPGVVRIPHVYLIPRSGGDGDGGDACRGGRGGAIVPSRCARGAVIVVNVDVIFGFEECHARESYNDTRPFWWKRRKGIVHYLPLSLDTYIV